MNGIRARLVFWNVIAIGLILTGMGLALRLQLQASLLGQIDTELEHDIAGVTTVHRPAGTLDEAAIAKDISDAKKHNRFIVRDEIDKSGIRLRQLNNNGSDEVNLVSEPMHPVLLPARTVDARLPSPIQPIDTVGYHAAQGGKRTFHDFHAQGRTLRSLSQPIYSGGRLLAVAQSAKDIAPVRASLRQLDGSLVTLFPLALLVAALAGALLVGSTMRPLRKLTEAARSLDPDLSKERLPIVGKDEFADLAVAFNEAFDRTASAFASQTRALQQLERFTGDAGHELRTPLGAIKGSVSFLIGRRKWSSEIGKSLEIIDRSSDRMTLLIGDLLLLARHGGGNQVLAMVLSPLEQVFKEALDVLDEPEGVTVQIGIDSNQWVYGDSDSLSRLFTNLLANAFAYARTTVCVRAIPAAESLKITIEDDGEGIAPKHLSRLGERFYRPESSRSRTRGGTGLGLAIARTIAEAHGGSIQIESTVGVGTKVEVILPQTG